MKKYLITAASLFCSLLMYAQQGFVSVGGDTKSAGGSVSFSVGQVDYNYYSNGSSLVIEGLQQPYEISGPLPITLLYFKANATKENAVILNWSTTSENNNDYFTIERSRDASIFEKVTSVLSKGNSTINQDYAATDFQPYQGASYYRLTQTDKDGKFSLSQIEKVLLGGSQFTATASPNPTRDIVQLRINGEINKTLNYLLFDISGKVLMKANIANSVTPINLGNLAQGTYLLKIMQEGKSVQTFKILKQN
ncbi:MAG: T9SS type A sorting domain-containing protein [Ginsengibacter sp.]